MEFSARVREVRKALNISQEDLARKLNVSFSTVNRWENGKTEPSRLARGNFDTFCKKHSKKIDNLDKE